MAIEKPFKKRLTHTMDYGIMKFRNVCWFNKSGNACYLSDRNFIMPFFFGMQIKEINLFVSYEQNGDYGICFSKSDKEAYAFLEHKTVFSLFEWVEEQKLKLVEFKLILSGGVHLFSYFGDDVLGKNLPTHFFTDAPFFRDGNFSQLGIYECTDSGEWKLIKSGVSSIEQEITENETLFCDWDLE
jgi:hypothetical protein